MCDLRYLCPVLPLWSAGVLSSRWFNFSCSNLCLHAGLWVWHFNDALFALLISALQDDVCKERAEEKAPATFCQLPGASFNNHRLPQSKHRYCYEYQEMNIRTRARVKARERVRALGLRRRGGKQKAKGILTLQ